MGSKRRISFVAGVALIAALTLPPAASASVSCSLTTGVLTVDISTGTAQVGIQRGTGGGASDINVYDGGVNGGTLQGCTGSPTVNNTDSIQVTDTVASHSATLELDLQHGPFEPGATAEGTGTSEIEVTFNGSDGTDRLRLVGQSTAANTFVFGQTGASAVGGNLNADADVDDVIVNNGEQMFLEGGSQADDISVAGGTGFTGPVPYVSGGFSVLHIDGGLNDDDLTAGPGGWVLDLSSAFGNDTLNGGSGDDVLGAWGPGDDAVDGAGGNDLIDYQFAQPGNVHFDLGTPGPQDTVVAGTDTATNVEGIVGSQFAGTDVLGGNGLANTFVANDGDDVITPKGGNDTVYGGLGTDTVGYAVGSLGPVAVSLGTTAPQATGGAGTDTFPDVTPSDGLPDVENLIGSPFAGDALTGNGLANVLDVYDGFADSVDCAGDSDTAIADEVGVDSISNCEVTDNAPQTSISSGPANGSTINTATPTYGLSADEPSTFEVKVDSGSFQPCSASCTVPALGSGTHTLSFRAVDVDESQHPDLTSATRTVTVSLPGPPDTTAPDTLLGLHPHKKTTNRRATFTFSSTELAGSFLCSVDGKPYKPCNSPFTSAKLKRGKHRFQVFARDSAGNQDPSAATFFWKVIKRKRR
jgi:hypothetical protein